jgi:hypothetical protein
MCCSWCSYAFALYAHASPSGAAPLAFGQKVEKRKLFGADVLMLPHDRLSVAHSPSRAATDDEQPQRKRQRIEEVRLPVLGVSECSTFHSTANTPLIDP